MIPPEESRIAQLRAQAIIFRILYATIATADPNGRPWISPVYCAFDAAYNFYWISARTALHSMNIQNNPAVALVIYDSTAPEGTGEGVYVRAKAYEINEVREIAHGLAVLNARAARVIRTHQEVADRSPKRLYKAEPEEVWMNTDRDIEGFVVDCRIPIDLPNGEVAREAK